MIAIPSLDLADLFNSPPSVENGGMPGGRLEGYIDRGWPMRVAYVSSRLSYPFTLQAKESCSWLHFLSVLFNLTVLILRRKSRRQRLTHNTITQNIEHSPTHYNTY